MSECVKIGDSLVCFPDDIERFSDQMSILNCTVSDVLEYAHQLEEKRFAIESGLIATVNQLLSLVKELSDIRTIEKELRNASDEMKEALEEISGLYHKKVVRGTNNES